MSLKTVDSEHIHSVFEDIEDEFLAGSYAEFVDEGGADLLSRWYRHRLWLDGRLAHRVDPYSKVTTARIAAETASRSRGAEAYAGVNFGSQDYLSLASHPAVCAAATQAVAEFGVHSAGSAALMGNTALSVDLERRLAEFLGYRDCTLFPTGWGAGYGAIKTLVRPDDHVVIDVLAHACLQEGARNATANVHRFPHLSNAAVERRLKRIRAEHPSAGIMVVTETVFSMDSDVPDISDLQRICHANGALLLVDVAHDLGCIGPSGRGHLETQDMVGKVDLVMGSFSKTFASNGGFVACNDPSLKLALRYHCGPLAFTNALSPVQAAVVLRALEIVDSPEGSRRRERLRQNVLRLRSRLRDEGFGLLGQPTAIVPVILGGNALSRLITRYTLEGGGIVNLVEYPAVSRNTCRWRLQVMADHETEQIDAVVGTAVEARDKARAHLESIRTRREATVAEPLATE